MNFLSFLLTTGCLFAVSNGLGLTYKQQPELIWDGQTTNAVGGSGVREGNGLFLSPDGDTLVSTSVDATVRAFDPVTGNVKWTYWPSTNSPGRSMRCYGGVTFSNHQGSGTPFLVYAIADGANDPVDNPGAMTRVIALSMESGEEIFQSTPLFGVAAGTPVTDSDGTHILLTHNEDSFKGYMSIFYLSPELFQQQGGTMIPTVFTGTFNDGSASKPFSPIGYFHNPAEGFYDGGQGNTNDFFMFAFDTPKNATSVGTNDGQKFFVQFPMSYMGDGGQGSLSFGFLGKRVDYHSSTPPVITNSGRSYYWSVSKSVQHCLIGIDALPRWHFDRNRLTAAVSMQRGRPRYRSSRAPPTVGQELVCGVGAAAQVWCMDHLCSQNPDIISTPEVVSSRIVFTADEDYVLYGTQSSPSTMMSSLSPTGGLYMNKADNLQEQKWWIEIAGGGVEGDIAMNSAGTMVYVANPAGEVRAYRFAQ